MNKNDLQIKIKHTKIDKSDADVDQSINFKSPLIVYLWYFICIKS